MASNQAGSKLKMWIGQMDWCGTPRWSNSASKPNASCSFRTPNSALRTPHLTNRVLLRRVARKDERILMTAIDYQCNLLKITKVIVVLPT
jgi:hypothetical protein